MPISIPCIRSGDADRLRRCRLSERTKGGLSTVINGRVSGSASNGLPAESQVWDDGANHKGLLDSDLEGGAD